MNFIKEFVKEYRDLVIFQVMILTVALLPISDGFKISFDVLMMIGVIAYCIREMNRQIEADMRKNHPDLYKYIDEKKKNENKNKGV